MHQHDKSGTFLDCLSSRYLLDSNNKCAPMFLMNTAVVQHVMISIRNPQSPLHEIRGTQVAILQRCVICVDN